VQVTLKAPAAQLIAALHRLSPFSREKSAHRGGLADDADGTVPVAKLVAFIVD